MKEKLEFSRMDIELFIECPRCFWLKKKFNIKRPEKIAGGFIGSKYDPLLKRYFDKHRNIKKTPQEIEKYNLSLFFNLKKLTTWRNQGIIYFHERHNAVYFGKIDDILVEKTSLVPFDFKATISRNFQVYESYKRQLEIYGYLLKQNGEKVSNKGVLYVVKIDIDENFEKIEEREVIIIEDLNYEIYDEILENLIETYHSKEFPNSNSNCEFCKRDQQILELYKLYYLNE